MVDMQLGHGMSELAETRFAGEQGWFFSQGEEAGTSPEFFTVASMTSAGSDQERADPRRSRRAAAPSESACADAVRSGSRAPRRFR
jgi:hypothetical protein